MRPHGDLQALNKDPEGNMQRGNIFTGICGPFAEERMQSLLTGVGVRLERILSWGQASPAGYWYDQEEAEWVLLLSGHARLRLAEPDEILELNPGDYVLIPSHRRHRVDWTAPDEATVWLTLFLARS